MKLWNMLRKEVNKSSFVQNHKSLFRHGGGGLCYITWKLHSITMGGCLCLREKTQAYPPLPMEVTAASPEALSEKLIKCYKPLKVLLEEQSSGVSAILSFNNVSHLLVFSCLAFWLYLRKFIVHTSCKL